jgi:hypothetical protein
MPERRAVHSAPSFFASSRYSKAGCSNFETRLIPIQKRPSEPQQRFRGFLLILHQSGVPEFSLVWPDKMLLLLLISRLESYLFHPFDFDYEIAFLPVFAPTNRRR